MFPDKKGFTLIEMLAVIAIIAVLVAVVIPVVGSATVKARAAADAANLRSTLGALNTAITNKGDLEQQVIDIYVPESRYEEDCELHVLYTHPGFIEVYYVSGENYYSLEYLADIATNGETGAEIPGKPSTGGTWYQAGVGKISETP